MSPGPFWAGCLLVAGIQVAVMFGWQDRYADGIATRPFVARLQRKVGGYPELRFPIGVLVRLAQTVFVALAASPSSMYLAILLALLLDDYLFGGDRNRWRWWRTAKNHVRWKMLLPSSDHA